MSTCSRRCPAPSPIIRYGRTCASSAGVVNMAMLVVAAAALRGRDASTLTGIQSDLGALLGRGAAVTFALTLLASGLASSSVGTYAGQVIMEGFLRRRIPLLVRRLATMAPAFALLTAGADPVRLLIVSHWRCRSACRPCSSLWSC